MLYIIILITCTSVNQCTYAATEYQDLTYDQCQQLLPTVSKDLPANTTAQCVELDVE